MPPPKCTNCGGSDFVWANEVRAGSKSISIRPRGEIMLGARICRACGSAEFFLHDTKILHEPVNWLEGEFVSIRPSPAPVAPRSPPTTSAVPTPPIPQPTEQASPAVVPSASTVTTFPPGANPASSASQTDAAILRASVSSSPDHSGLVAPPPLVSPASRLPAHAETPQTSIPRSPSKSAPTASPPPPGSGPPLTPRKRRHGPLYWIAVAIGVIVLIILVVVVATFVAVVNTASVKEHITSAGVAPPPGITGWASCPSTVAPASNFVCQVDVNNTGNVTTNVTGFLVTSSADLYGDSFAYEASSPNVPYTIPAGRTVIFSIGLLAPLSLPVDSSTYATTLNFKPQSSATSPFVTSMNVVVTCTGCSNDLNLTSPAFSGAIDDGSGLINVQGPSCPQGICSSDVTENWTLLRGFQDSWWCSWSFDTIQNGSLEVKVVSNTGQTVFDRSSNVEDALVTGSWDSFTP